LRIPQIQRRCSDATCGYQINRERYEAKAYYELPEKCKLCFLRENEEKVKNNNID